MPKSQQSWVWSQDQWKAADVAVLNKVHKNPKHPPVITAFIISVDWVRRIIPALTQCQEKWFCVNSVNVTFPLWLRAKKNAFDVVSEYGKFDGFSMPQSKHSESTQKCTTFTPNILWFSFDWYMSTQDNFVHHCSQRWSIKDLCVWDFWSLRF